MMTFRTDNPKSCGIVELDQNNIIIGFHEKVSTPPGNLAIGAVYILSNELITFLKNEMKAVSDFSNEVLHHFLGKIYNYETTDTFIDIGTPESYLKSNTI